MTERPQPTANRLTTFGAGLRPRRNSDRRSPFSAPGDVNDDGARDLRPDDRRRQRPAPNTAEVALAIGT